MTAPQGWQPIETAPKDGRQIAICFASPYGSRFVSSAAWIAEMEDWNVDDAGIRGVLHIFPPTHWTELPDE